MRFFLFVLLIAALPGCDRLTGADVKKNLDAEAIGYACRISMKTPEDCMKENETQSPTSVLFGWKEADKDIREKNIDPSMGKPALQAPPLPQSAPAAAETESKTDKAPESAVARAESMPAKHEKPAEKGAAKKKATH